MKDPDDKIRLNKAERKEAFLRRIYVYWQKEMNDRRVAGQCPKCGYKGWIQRGSGFHKKWICDKCGLSITRKDWITGQIWWDFVRFYALKEIKRIKSASRKSQDIRNYEKEGLR